MRFSWIRLSSIVGMNARSVRGVPSGPGGASSLMYQRSSCTTMKGAGVFGTYPAGTYTATCRSNVWCCGGSVEPGPRPAPGAPARPPAASGSAGAAAGSVHAGVHGGGGAAAPGVMPAFGGTAGCPARPAPPARGAGTGAVGKILLSAEFIVNRITRPFGTLGFSVNAGSVTYGGAMRKLPRSASRRTGTSGGALAGRAHGAGGPG